MRGSEEFDHNSIAAQPQVLCPAAYSAHFHCHQALTLADSMVGECVSADLGPPIS